MEDRLNIIQGDITELDVDAIVNAANEMLLGGGGVDGAIHRAAGPELLEECRTLGGCEMGQAKITGGYDLKADWIIHTVGPVWQGGDANEDNILAQCYRDSLALAQEHPIETIAFPAISTGAYRFPVERAARIAITEVLEFLKENDTPEHVVLVCYGDRTYDIYQKVLQEICESRSE
ncbi:MAG: O-acetyl-ADP-ribose deacetylase [Anaerolineae bacterium]